MACHGNFCSIQELEQVVNEEISKPMGMPAEVFEPRTAENSDCVVRCNGRVLTARSNCKMRDEIRKMKREGTLLPYFKTGFGIQP